MSIKNNRSRKNPFVLIEISTLRDPEILKLSANAFRLWIYMRAAFNPRKEECFNLANGKIQVYLPYTTIQRIKGLNSPHTVAKALRELQEKQFIELTERGRGNGSMNAYHFIGRFAEFPEKRKDFKK